MQTSSLPISKFLKNDQGFSIIEILVALLLAALVFLIIPSNESSQKHRELRSAVDDIDRSIRFAGNESILRNTIVRLRINLEKNPIEYSVEYGPAGNLPLPDMQDKASPSLAEQKAEKDQQTSLNRQFTKVEEFEDIKHALGRDVDIIGLASSSQRKLLKEGDASLYFYPTGEKDGGLIFFTTDEEIAYLEIEPFLAKTRSSYQTLKIQSIAKPEDIIQTKIDEVYKEWISK